MGVIAAVTQSDSRRLLSAPAVLHNLLWLYNGLAVLLVAGFFFVTQAKIIDSMSAYSFLMMLPLMPWPAGQGLLAAALSYLALFLLGHLYHRAEVPELRYLALTGEIIACIVLLRCLGLAYDGVVLLVVADLMHRYDGRNRLLLLTCAMLGLYFLADYNLLLFQGSVAPFEAYASYYAGPVRGVLLAARGGLISLNLVLFALYLVLLIQDTHEEKERVRLLNEQLAAANRQLRAYALEAESLAETRERNRLAREIHDTLGHTLTGLAAGLDACLVLVEAAPEAARAQMQKLAQVARHGLTDVRRSVSALRPETLEKLPLREAVTSMAREFQETSGMRVQLAVLGWPEHLRDDQEETIYRIVQEALTNANRHGQASQATVTIGTEPGRMFLIIADNGRGCEKAEPGFGLRHMRERLELLHGRLRCWSEGGFTLEAIIPLGEEQMAGGKQNDKGNDS